MSLETQKTLIGLKRAALLVKGVTGQDVHDDVVAKGGPMRSDQIDGTPDLVIGDATGQAEVHATLN